MNAHVLLNLLNELGKRILLTNFALKHHDFAIRKRDVFMDVNG